uniref:Secreted protein n=1 Tax=Magallana gigas TaxID=29159 RepID=A0A8W8KD82_MAGGI
MTVLRFFLLAVLVKCAILDNPLDFMSENQKRNLGTLKLESLPDNEHRVLREVILHGNATSSPMYTTTYQSKVINTSCPDQNLVCCKGYVLVAEHCLPLSEIPAIKDDLIDLHHAGVLG